MKFKATAILFLAAVALAFSCKQQDEEEVELQYYTTEVTYDVACIPSPEADAEVRNVIFMICDGMGLEQTSCAWVLNKGKLYFDNFPVVGLSRTYSADNLITDSGAGGTALAAGQKTGNNHVGTDINNEPLYSMLYKAHSLGWKTGVVVTCHLADATPVDFCCHNEHRYNTEAIIADYVNCDVDYIAGGGYDYFGNGREDGRIIADEMVAKGYTLACNEEELMAAQLPVLGLLAGDNLPVAQERGDMFRHMVMRGIEQLSAASEGKGFAMMIEGSCIDDWLHGNDIGKAMEELLDFDRTIGDVLKWAANDGHTLVVVTADHATGALTLQDGDLEEGKIGVAFGNESHNGIAVPYYVWGPGASEFGGILENEELGRKVGSFVK